MDQIERLMMVAGMRREQVAKDRAEIAERMTSIVGRMREVRDSSDLRALSAQLGSLAGDLARLEGVERTLADIEIATKA